MSWHIGEVKSESGETNCINKARENRNWHRTSRYSKQMRRRRILKRIDCSESMDPSPCCQIGTLDPAKDFEDWFLAALAALYLPCWLIHWFINYIEFIPNHTNLGRLCFAKHNAAHHDERTMPHTKFRHHNFNKIPKFWQNFRIWTEFHTFDRISQFWQNSTILTEVHNYDRIS